jgi:hypothetical protein
MAEVRFYSEVALVRVLHWAACRYPRRAPSMPDPVELPSSPDLLVAPSLVPDAGLGVFARRPFAEGELICTYVGHPLSTLGALRTPDWRYLAALGKDRRGRRVWVDARPDPSVIARYVNHHFVPERRNVRTESVPDEEKWLMRAGRPIAAGEELYCDYGRLHVHCFDRGLLAGVRHPG